MIFGKFSSNQSGSRRSFCYFWFSMTMWNYIGPGILFNGSRTLNLYFALYLIQYGVLLWIVDQMCGDLYWMTLCLSGSRDWNTVPWRHVTHDVTCDVTWLLMRLVTSRLRHVTPIWLPGVLMVTARNTFRTLIPREKCDANWRCCCCNCNLLQF